MFDPIIERIFSYKKIILQNSKKYYQRLFNVIKNSNNYFSIISKKIKYQFDLNRKYYHLGKYLSQIKKNKYDLSQDKIFIDQMNKIKYKQELLNKTKKDLSLLYKNDKNYI